MNRLSKIGEIGELKHEITTAILFFQIIEDLDAGDETSDLLFGSKLDDIVRLMETDS